MTHIKNTRARRMTVAVVGAVAAVMLGVGGAIAVGAPDGGSADPTPVPTETSDGGSVGVSGGTDGGTTDGGGTDGGSVSGSGGVDPSPTPTDAPDPTDSPDPTDGPTPSPTGPASIDDLTKRIDDLEKKVDQLPTKKELADALRAFADKLEQED
ncbi:hypothetical protein ACFRCW_14015 [Streptomyces sp. NPDC056653]|uniref:hypothetical protein n=1 Tax=Streptomyces sp. NPDC056653 TaxID=3345894 RepID=UPI003678A53B